MRPSNILVLMGSAGVLLLGGLIIGTGICRKLPQPTEYLDRRGFLNIARSAHASRTEVVHLLGPVFSDYSIGCERRAEVERWVAEGNTNNPLTHFVRCHTNVILYSTDKTISILGFDNSGGLSEFLVMHQ